MKSWKKAALLATVLLLSLALLAGCGGTKEEGKTEGEGTKTEETAKLSGSIQIDGSSTVFPITEAVAEEFQNLYPEVQISVGVSGTGGGFKKFAAGEIDISDASRPIKDAEKAAAQEKGIEAIELSVAFDGLSVLVNKENTWVDQLTVEELKKIWEPNSKVMKWSDVRPEWPAENIKLYGPGTDSGTFDYFTDEINGEEGASRSDYTASEDDNVLVKGIEGDKYSLGYFGFAYYVENKDKLKIVPIDGGNGAIEPTEITINDGSYSPLSRPIFIYVSKTALEKTQVKEFVKFFLTEGPKLVSEVGYIPLPDSMYQDGLNKIE